MFNKKMLGDYEVDVTYYNDYKKDSGCSISRDFFKTLKDACVFTLQILKHNNSEDYMFEGEFLYFENENLFGRGIKHISTKRYLIAPKNKRFEILITKLTVGNISKSNLFYNLGLASYLVKQDT